MKTTIFKRAAAGNEKLWKVFWLLWIPYVILSFLISRFSTRMVDAHTGKLPLLAFMLTLALLVGLLWLLIALWKCSRNVRFSIFFWLTRVYVALQFIGLLGAAGKLLQAA